MDCKGVLVVEDDSDLAQVMEEVLQSEGYQVKKAPHGKAALEYLLKESKASLPGCIVLDLMMPVMDGRSFMTALISSGRGDLRQIPILLTTASRDPRTAIQGLPYPAEILAKPVDVETLVSHVARHCGRPS